MSDAAAEFYPLEVLSDTPRARISLVRHETSGVLCIQKELRRLGTPYPLLKGRAIPGIPRIYAVVESASETLVWEELITGEDLRRRLESEGTVDERTAASWMMQLCSILKKLHGMGVIHRDIKPSNLMITPEGRLYLIDFDAARVFDAGKGEDTVCLGTKGYAAPEQFGYAQTDMRTDIYSMGVVFCQLTTGSLPGEAPMRGRLSGILQTCTRLDPGQRYQSVDQVMDALKALYWPKAAGSSIHPLSAPSRAALSPVFAGGAADSKKLRERGIWRPVVCALFAALLVAADFTGDTLPLFSDRLVACIQHLFVLMPLLAFAVDLFYIRSCPPFASFREKKRKKWYYLLYFTIWFLSVALLSTLFSSLYSPEALRIIAAQ